MLAALGRLRLPGREDRAAVLAVGLLQIGAFFALAHLGAGVLTSGRTAILSNVTLIWLVPLSVLFLRERVSPARWGAAGLGLAGAVVLVGPWAADWSRPEVVVAHLLLLGAALVWSIAIVIVRRNPPKRPMIELLPWAFAAGALGILVPLAMWREPGGGIGVPAWPHALFIGIVAAPIGTWSVIEAGRRLPSTVVSVGFLLVPVLGVAVGALWLGEAVGWDVWLGGALIAGSVVAAIRG